MRKSLLSKQQDPPEFLLPDSQPQPVPSLAVSGVSDALRVMMDAADQAFNYLTSYRQNPRAKNVLSAVVPPSVQKDYAAMKADPQGWAKAGAKQAPSSTDVYGVIGSVAGAMPLGTVYHGTPNEWQTLEPDMSKIGTGQGAQSYGHGLYFAEEPKVAKGYASMAASDFQKSKVASELLAKSQGRVNTVEWQGRTLSTYDFAERLTRGEISAQSLPKDILQKVEQGYSYKATIPDEHIAKMLDWDKPLSEQSTSVKQALKDNWPLTGQDNYQSFLEDTGTTGGTIHRMFDWHFGRDPKTGAPGDYKKVADWLNSIGIPGIKYLDQGSRAAGQGTRNFVVFDPNIVKEVKKVK